MLAPAVARQRRFQLVLIKPSHYDDDGYVIQWMRSAIPSNSLAGLYGLAADAAQRQVLGADVAIDIKAIDETNTRVRVKDIIALTRGTTASAWSAWSACSPTSFPARSISPGRCAQAGIPVVIGGFHVSGCLAMLPEMQADLQAALDMGVSLFAGEAEEAGSTGAARRRRGDAEADLQLSWTTCRRSNATPTPLFAAADLVAHARPLHQLRCRPRLSVPVLVLHHHQRAGPQVAPALARRHRAADPPALRRRASAGSSSPTTISPATRTGNRSSTA